MCNKPAVWNHVDSDKHKSWIEDAVKKSGLPRGTKVRMNPGYNWGTSKEQWWTPPKVGAASPPSSGESGKGAAAAAVRSGGGRSVSDLSMGPAASDSGATAIVEKISDVSRQLQQLQDVSSQVDKVVAATCTITTNCDNYSRTMNVKIDGLNAKLDRLIAKLDDVVTKTDRLATVVEGCVQTVATMRTELAASRSSSIGCCGSSSSPQQQTMGS